jgi:hypothetical protein
MISALVKGIMRNALIGLVLLVSLSVAGTASAGAVFLTGHDPDFHAWVGGNLAGARNINNAAIDFILDPVFNPYTSTATTDFLFVESFISPPSGHVNGVNGIVASGYALNTDFEHHDASTLNAELDLLGTKYAGIVVASDFGGVLTQAELDILNARSADIIAFLNSGGGLYAMAESNSQGALTPNGGQFDFLPFIVTSLQLNQSETGYTVTPFGASLGLSDSDINGNASHNVFEGTPLGLSIVDVDAAGRIMSLAGRPENIPTVPEPSSLALLVGALAGLCGMRRKRS